MHSGKTWFVEAKLKQGIESAVQKKIVKLIKDSKLKVQAQIQGEEIRVTGKSRDDLQSVMALVRVAIWDSRSSSKTSATKAASRQQKAGNSRFFYTPLMSCSISKRLVTLLSILIYTERSSGTTSA